MASQGPQAAQCQPASVLPTLSLEGFAHTPPSRNLSHPKVAGPLAERHRDADTSSLPSHLSLKDGSWRLVRRLRKFSPVPSESPEMGRGSPNPSPHSYHTDGKTETQRGHGRLTVPQLASCLRPAVPPGCLSHTDLASNPHSITLPQFPQM